MTEKNSDRPAFEPRTAIGVFMCVFGLAVLGAIFFTDVSGADLVVNVVCGLAILGIGAFAIYLGIRKSGAEKK